jgi:hypothetical protein
VHVSEDQLTVRYRHVNYCHFDFIRRSWHHHVMLGSRIDCTCMCSCIFACARVFLSVLCRTLGVLLGEGIVCFVWASHSPKQFDEQRFKVYSPNTSIEYFDQKRRARGEKVADQESAVSWNLIGWSNRSNILVVADEREIVTPIAFCFIAHKRHPGL